MTQPLYTPYSTLEGFFPAPPQWVPTTLDQQRIQSYELYEKIYWSVPTVFKLAMRGTEDKPIYIPSARTIIDTTNRYVTPKFAVNPVSRTSQLETVDTQAAVLLLEDLFRRERFKSKFNGAKRFGLIQGDWVWHVTADPLKEPGSRISIEALDPSMYFPVWSDDDATKLIAVHLVELTTFDDNPAIRRQTYRKVFSQGKETGSVVGITVEDGIYDKEKWYPLNSPALRVNRKEERLPEQITTIPVYHIKNFEEPGNPFGSSEVRGLERLITALNQTVSDEELTLALEGIGMYATDAPQPIDPTTGNKIAWKLGPGRVVHHPPDTKWERVTGVSSVAPYGEHYDRIWEALKHGSNTPDVAIGLVDVTAAESGVALALKLSPMLSKAEEKNQIVLDVHSQMFFDLLNGWYPAYEQTSFSNVTVDCVAGDALPVDRQERFTELNDMLDKGVIDTVYYRDEAKKLGYVFPDDIQDRVNNERERVADQFAARLGREAGSGEA